ncbi:MAG: hypothetical protein A2W90_17210 [Bacteroidetes bacterium GWF2_42_66]|nr:MAG: hypothetical protein A2W92_19140 [Bacteroidetes bacterium GWA2_42_15]OFY03012.1 MAG: hypothetical protein A2W89_04535 [Bacteroidetes bacterium GWE2_42_39]OFY43264.1 MAG: hypothetical protein A2W90_17210 [Bacteroidetes bacterium GWF2_42_66]HAZ04567.1 hypothetical protein [Marinilabiliales bacterium]HBL77277.1 hypothetical protein [Prolixibacteraceae bacterium]
MKLYSIILISIFLHIVSSSFGFSFESFSAQNIPASNIIEEEKSISVKKVYPNPVKNKLTIEISVKTEGELVIKIYDILGNEIIKKNLFVNKLGLNTINFDLSYLRSGIYILKAVKETDAVSVRIKKQ